MPVKVQRLVLWSRQCRIPCRSCSLSTCCWLPCCGAEADPYGPVISRQEEIPLSQYINKEVDILVVLVVQVPQVQFLGAVDVPVAGHVRCWGRDIAENCGGSAVTVHRRGRSSWTRLLRCSLLDTSGVGVETLPKTVEVPQLQFIAMVVQYVDNVVDVPVGSVRFDVPDSAEHHLEVPLLQLSVHSCFLGQRVCGRARRHTGSGMFLAGSASGDEIRAVFPSVVGRPKCSASWSVWTEGQFSVAPRFLDVSRLRGDVREEPSMANSRWSSRARRCRNRREFYSHVTWHPNSAHARAAASTKTSSLHHVHLPPSPTHTHHHHLCNPCCRNACAW